jgi:probable F420-dependent oxidoreductase
MRFVTTTMRTVYASRPRPRKRIDSALRRRHRRAVQLGVVLRNMGPASAPDTVLAAARAADETTAVADVWVADHIAIPPDDAEGSGGRYLDPLATLAVVAGATRRVGLGTSVLVLPYRPALATAKWVATIQELSGGRLRLGVGSGWMAAEFRALGVDRRRRGRITDDTLDFLDRCFASDVVEANGQPFYFRPRPPRPALFIGGAPAAAFRRVLAHRAGWMPMGLAPDALRAPAAELRAAAAAAGLAPPPIAVLAALPRAEAATARDTIAAYAEAGATQLIHGERYASVDEFRRILDDLARAAA